MRTFADQANTVERVVVPCPSGGSVKAIVALGNLLKTSSQKWFIAANGPITQALTPTILPPYSTGRISPPSTTSVSCVGQVPLYIRLKFKAGAAWVCNRAVASWDCSLKGQNFVMALAQLALVDGNALQMQDINAIGADVSISCSVVINSVKNSVASLQFITATTLLNSIRYLCNSTGAASAASGCHTDPYLSAFDWPMMMTFVGAPSSTKSPAAHFFMNQFIIGAIAGTPLCTSSLVSFRHVASHPPLVTRAPLSAASHAVSCLAASTHLKRPPVAAIVKGLQCTSRNIRAIQSTIILLFDHTTPAFKAAAAVVQPSADGRNDVNGANDCCISQEERQQSQGRRCKQDDRWPLVRMKLRVCTRR